MGKPNYLHLTTYNTIKYIIYCTGIYDNRHIHTEQQRSQVLFDANLAELPEKADVMGKPRLLVGI